MNDFTKEELIRLFEWGMSLADSFPDCFCNEDTNLYLKIQSMIDGHDAKVVECWHCEKCGHVQ